jgi:predicted esterase
VTDEAHYAERRLTVARTARVGVIGPLAPATTDVWIVLHGYGQLAETFAASAHWPAAPHRAFVFPEALQRFYDADSAGSHAAAPVGASWMTREAREDDIADNHAYLDAVLRDALMAAPSAKLTAFGFSQGTATITRWTVRRILAGAPPARLVLWGGALPADVDLGPAAPLRAVPVTLVHGTRDHWATPERVRAERERLTGSGFPVTLHQFEGGHRLDDTMLATIAGG